MADDTVHRELDRAERLLCSAEFEAALQVFDDAVRADDGNVAAQSGRVRALWALRDFARARRALADVARSSANDPTVLAARGTIALGAADHPLHISIIFGSAGRDDRAALAAFHAAVAADPTSLPGWRGLAMAHRLSQRIDQARWAVDAGLARHPNAATLRIQRAWCLHDGGRLDDARAEVSATLTETPDDCEALFVQAFLARIAYDYDVAASTVATIGRLHPDHALLAVEKEALEIETRYRRPRSESGSHVDVADRSVDENGWRWPALRWKRYSRAIDAGRTADEIRRSPLFVQHDAIAEPPSPTLLEVRGLQLAACAALRDGDVENADTVAALDAYRACRAADPHHSTVLASEARLHAELGRVDDARRLLAEALAMSPGYPQFTAEVGWVESHCSTSSTSSSTSRTACGPVRAAGA